RQTRDALGNDALLIALDEFEELEEKISRNMLPPDLLKVLRGYVQMDPRIAFVFAGLHTLEEMSADYFQPFFASVIPVKVSFLSREATFQVLANPPDPDFPLDYAPEALERIWELTGGQPYLAQWIGHCLVSRFNDLTFERGRPQESVFQEADVEAVIRAGDFFTGAQYYFSGVWGQAARGAPGQHTVLKVLASHPGGLSVEELRKMGNLSAPALQKALEELERHDVLCRNGEVWRFTVELMRRWVAKYIPD
ncbi:MAG: MarR family transcriptional regulator, partial [Calditrichaeota bacterium]